MRRKVHSVEAEEVIPTYNPFYYKPLPEEITIRQSEIEGLGVFAVVDIPKDTDLGTTHINVPMYNGLIRTPIGGFLNHEDNANCVLDMIHDWDDCQIYNVVTRRKIKANEELTLDYNV